MHTYKYSREEIADMNKKLFVLLIALISAAMLLAGCSGEATAIALDTAEDGSGATVTFVNADKDDFVMGGSLEIGEGQKIVVEEDIEEGGSAAIRFIGGAENLDENADMEDISKSVDPDNYTVEAIVDGSGRSEFGGIEPGSYYIRVDVKKKNTSGTAKISLE